MSTKLYSVVLPTISGGQLSCSTYLTDEQRDHYRASGYEVNMVINTVPVWAVNAGLTRPWCFVQDLLNFNWQYLFTPRS